MQRRGHAFRAVWFPRIVQPCCDLEHPAFLAFPPPPRLCSPSAACASAAGAGVVGVADVAGAGVFATSRSMSWREQGQRSRRRLAAAAGAADAAPVGAADAAGGAALLPGARGIRGRAGLLCGGTHAGGRGQACNYLHCQPSLQPGGLPPAPGAAAPSMLWWRTTMSTSRPPASNPGQPLLSTAVAAALAVAAGSLLPAGRPQPPRSSQFLDQAPALLWRPLLAEAMPLQQQARAAGAVARS